MAIEAFRGTYPQKVDSKARVSIPAAMRRILEEGDPQPEGASAKDSRPRVYMIFGGADRDYVECYHKAGADALADLISQMELASEDRNEAEWDLMGNSVMVEIEPDGRIVLPPPVRAKIGFGPDELAQGGEAVFLGTNKQFRLYRREVFEAVAAARKSRGIDPLALVGRATKSG